MTLPGPVVSVVIPTYNRPEALDACLAALARQDLQEPFEVIVVDDGGSDQLEPLIGLHRQDLDLHLFRQRNAGPGAARNRGAQSARGELLAFTDDDCLPEVTWLSELLAYHRRHPDVLIGGYTATQPGRNLYSDTAQFILDCACLFYNKDSTDARFHASSNMAVGRNRYLDADGFNESFRIASEDREFCTRWRLLHGRIHELNSARVIHAKALNLSEYARQFFRYGRGAWQYRQFRERASLDDIDSDESHAAFLRCVFQSWRAIPRGPKWRMCLLLGVWQVSNLAGFLFAALHNGRDRTSEKIDN